MTWCAALAFYFHEDDQIAFVISLLITFGSGFLNVGYLSACVRDNIEYERKAFCKTIPTWQPIFEPDSTALGALGDAIFKINQAVPDYLGAANIRRLTGMEGDNG